MFTLKTITQTWLKSKPIQSSELWDNQKFLFQKGSTISVESVIPMENQHSVITLNQSLQKEFNSYKTLYGYTPHLEIIGDSNKRELFLNVPYFSQLNNQNYLFGPGSRQCNLTACAMYAAYLKPSLLSISNELGYTQFDSYYGDILSKYGDTTDHYAQTEALKELCIESYFSYSLSISDLVLCLQKNTPVVIGVTYKNSGHIIIVTGFNLDKELIYVHDSYGIRYGSSDIYEVGVEAKYDPYSFDLLKRIWVDMGDEKGWGRIATSIDGKSTKLPYNL